MRTGVKPCVRAAAFVIAATLLLLSGCAAQEGGAYLTVNGEETDDAVYIYYLKSAMYRVMAMYEAESSTGAFWEAELTGGETSFDTAKRLGIYNKRAFFGVFAFVGRRHGGKIPGKL